MGCGASAPKSDPITVAAAEARTAEKVARRAQTTGPDAVHTRGPALAEPNADGIARNAKGSEEPHSDDPELWNIDGTEMDLEAKYKVRRRQQRQQPSLPAALQPLRLRSALLPQAASQMGRDGPLPLRTPLPSSCARLLSADAVLPAASHARSLARCTDRRSNVVPAGSREGCHQGWQSDRWRAFQ